MSSTAAIHGAVTLAPALSGDLDEVMHVMERAFSPEFGEAWTRSQCAGILPMSGVLLTIARTGADEAQGFSLLRTAADEAELLLIAVAPKARQQGIGRRLLDHFIGHAEHCGATRLHLEVRDGNLAVRMYRAAGFETSGRRRNYYRGHDGTQFDALTLVRGSSPA
ncbi:MAG: GNAT family N-acetyltransferase [Sphingomicrobium sp.]|nr:GNAT family N-acetyltransferase [Sphingomonadales bacterium]